MRKSPGGSIFIFGLISGSHTARMADHCQNTLSSSTMANESSSSFPPGETINRNWVGRYSYGIGIGGECESYRWPLSEMRLRICR
jgi:hypothetical protein